MEPLTILHLSDLHWSTSNQPDLKIVIKALHEDLKKLKLSKGIQPDIIVFSGDLALGADSNAWLQEAYAEFLQPTADVCGLSLDRLFLVPGNHDISRDTVRQIPSIQKGLNDRLKSTSEINLFLDEKSGVTGEKTLALKRMEVFYESHDSYQPEAISSRYPLFLRTYAVDIRGCKVGVACFNTAWRSSGEAGDEDYQRLIIGERIVDQSLDDLQGCDFKIAIHHHPLDWLNTADGQTSDFLLRRSFNFSCCGHVHSARPFMSRDGVGTCVTSQTGSVFAGRGWFNGYTVIQVDLPTRTFTFNVREYHDKERRFDVATSVCDGGTVVFENVGQGDSRRADQVELFLRSYRDTLRSRVWSQMNLLGDTPTTGMNHPDRFVSPPIVKRGSASLESDSQAEPQEEEHRLDDLLETMSNVLVLGDRHTGKTTIAFQLAYIVAFHNHSDPLIPVYIDLRSYKFNDIALRRAINNFYGPSPGGFDLERAVQDGLFLFIADNLPTDAETLVKLSAHVEQTGGSRWICFSTPGVAGVSPDRVYNEHIPSFVKFHIKELTRGRIRSLSKHWCAREGLEEKEIFQAVMNQIVRDGLPRTPYMVSLLLWAMQQKKTYQKINEALLLSNIVDHLIGKADFRLSARGVLNPIGKEITLQEFAKFLHANKSLVTENEAISFLIDFFQRKRLPYIGSDVLEKLVLCGILKIEGEMVSFKYACFQEYFFASLLKNDGVLLKHYLTELNFLDVRREIELLSGLRQQNDDLIGAISSVLTARAPERFRARNAKEFDRIAGGELKPGTTKAQLNEIRRTRLTNEQLDEMMDEVDRRALSRGERKVSESIERADGNIVVAAHERQEEAIEKDRATPKKPLTPATHMAAIDILARVIRNSDFTDYEIKGPATKAVLDSWVRIFLVVTDELKAVVQSIGTHTGVKIVEAEEMALLYILSKHIFNVIGSAVTNQMSSPAIVNTLHSLVEDGELSTGEYLLILFFLEDVDDHDWQEKWAEVIRDKSRSGFVIDCFVDRLWHLAYSKALDDNQVVRVRSLVTEIEKRLDWPSSRKSTVLQHIRKAAEVAKAKDRPAGI